MGQLEVVMLLHMEYFQIGHRWPAPGPEVPLQAVAEVGGNPHSMVAGMETLEYVDCIFHSFTHLQRFFL